jgi:glycosyltransferase involved in cell wall biosynthesis
LKIGIVASTYNRKEHLRRLADSIFAQDYQNFVLYLCDDASTDGTSEFCQQLVDMRPQQVVHLRQEKNWGNVTRGRNDAILRGLDVDKVDAFVFADDDNWWKPNRLSAQAEFMQTNPTCGMSWCHCQAYKFENNGLGEGTPGGVLREGEPHHYDRQFLLSRPYIDSNEMMIRSRVFEEVGLFDERLPTLEDWDMTLRIGLRFPCLHLDTALINYALHNSNRVQQTFHLNNQSGQFIAGRVKLEGPSYRVLFVTPPERQGIINHSHKQVMGYLDGALSRLNFVTHRTVTAHQPIESIAADFRPNLIIYLYPARQPASAMEFLGGYPFPSLGLCIEDPYAHGMNKEVRHRFEWFVTNEKSCLGDYRNKPNALVMPTLSADPIIHQGKYDPEKAWDIVIVGAPYAKRRNALKALTHLALPDKLKVLVVGEGWAEHAPEWCHCVNHNIEGQEYADLCASAKITLIVNRHEGLPRPVTPARGFIEAYAGGCLLMESDRADLSRYFEPGKEFIGWTEESELIEQARMLLADDNLRQNLRQAAQLRATQYTYDRRLTRLFMLTRAYRQNDEVK